MFCKCTIEPVFTGVKYVSVPASVMEALQVRFSGRTVDLALMCLGIYLGPWLGRSDTMSASLR